jgi:hypothetical protein
VPCMKRTYSSAGATASRRIRRRNSGTALISSQSQSQSQSHSESQGGDDDDDPFGFSDGSPAQSQSQQDSLSVVTYHKMSTDTRRTTSLNTKSAGRIRAQMDDLQVRSTPSCG